MASNVSICNQALSWLGAQLITSLDDNTAEAKLCKANYADIRDAITEAHDWTFAITRYNLPKNATAPVNGYSASFQIPPEVLRVLSVSDNDDWGIEGQDIVTNEASVKMKAIARVTDPNRFSPLFIQALANRLAADLSIPLTQSKSLQKQHYALYQSKMDEAVTNDGLQGKSRKVTSSWLRGARFAGPSNNSGPTV